jgi:hypothetical protein
MRLAQVPFSCISPASLRIVAATSCNRYGRDLRATGRREISSLGSALCGADGATAVSSVTASGLRGGLGEFLKIRPRCWFQWPVGASRIIAESTTVILKTWRNGRRLDSCSTVRHHGENSQKGADIDRTPIGKPKRWRRGPCQEQGIRAWRKSLTALPPGTNLILIYDHSLFDGVPSI